MTSAGREHYGASGTNGAKAKASKAPQDILDDCQAVNGGKGGINKSYFRHNNCAFCSVAYEMRRRGDQVRSQEALEGVSQEAINKAIKNLKSKDIKEVSTRTTNAGKAVGMSEKEYDNMVDDILKDGENSRGQVTLQWKGANEHTGNLGGHALNYEVKDGTFYLVDPQINKVYSGKQAYKYLSDANNVKTIRTDNKQFDKNITEKYYTEKDTGPVEITNKAQRANNAAAAVTFVTQCIPVVNLVAYVPDVIALSVTAKKAEKEKASQTIELEEKWQKENRKKYYDYGKTEGGKKK